MKALVMSDTHRNLKAAQRVLEVYDDAATVFFLGDMVEDGLRLKEAYGGRYFWLVAGNNDPSGSAPEKLVLPWGGRRLALAHGHQFRTYAGLLRICLWGEEQEADVVLFGHTHVPVLVQEGKVVLCNPGSLSRPRSTKEPTFALLTAEEGKFEISLFLVKEKGFSCFAKTVL